VRLWDAFADLIAGRAVDRTMTRWGKFRPFILFFAVPLPGVLPVAGASAVLIVAAVVASLIPAARASHVDVMQALRSE